MKTRLRLPFYLAWQYIRRGRKWTLALTLMMMTIAFINLIFISSLFTGVIDGTNQQIINTMTGNIYITPQDGRDFISDKDSILNEIKDTSGIVAASAQMQAPASLEYNHIRGNWQILAVNPEDEKLVTNVASKIISGSYISKDDEDQIIIGRQIAGGQDVEENAFSFKGAKVGEKVTLNFNGFSKDFTIKGIFYTKFLDSDKRAFISEKSLDEIVEGDKNKATTITVKTGAGVDEDNTIKTIKKELDNDNVYSWKEVAGLMKSVAESFTNINILMSFVGVLIAAVTIFIIIYVDITNKRKQIGILRAIGIKPYIIILSYVILSAIYAVIGVVLGTLIFRFALMPYFEINPFSLPICDAVLVLTKTNYIIRAETIMWVSVLSGLIPAAITTRIKMLDEIIGR